MNNYIILLSSLLPVALLAFYIWHKDPLKEPASELIKAFLNGVWIIIPILIVEFIITTVFISVYQSTDIVSTIFDAFCVAAIPEETFKLFALWLVVRKNPYFDEHFDGIIYAVYVSLGFAAVENIGYVFGEEDWVTVAIARSLLAVPGHYAFGVLMGYYYSTYHFVSPTRKNAILILAAPVLAHGIYDAVIMAMPLNEIYAGVASFILIFFCIRLHKRAYRKITAMIEKDAELKANSSIAIADTLPEEQSQPYNL